ncbi:Nif11-like leader peptide family natural product precursor [Luminiphilus sp.]|nr:Nif11-like leader peptide family natural product precursor [Luminiphilus sp.]MDA9711585.1 Nif11-like leader peptide family natural product precursor [Luminiphilus sp.]
MSLDQANAFRDYVAQNEDVQREIRSALMTESAKVSEIAAKHGFTFTSEEAEQAWDAAQDNELSDFELDMVAGGGRGGNGKC